MAHSKIIKKYFISHFKSPMSMLQDKLPVSHQKWTDMTLDMESDMNPSNTDKDLDKDQISDNTSKNHELGQTTNMCVRPIMLPMITDNHVTETSCQKSKNYFHTGRTKRISCRLIVLFLLICCLLTFLYFIYRAFSFLKSYSTQNWDEMLEHEYPIKKIECYFQKCRKIFRR